MEAINRERMPYRSVIKWLRKKVSSILQYKMVVGVLLVRMQGRDIVCMEKQPNVKQEKAQVGQTMSTPLTVLQVSLLVTPNVDITTN